MLKARRDSSRRIYGTRRSLSESVTASRCWVAAASAAAESFGYLGRSRKLEQPSVYW